MHLFSLELKDLASELIDEYLFLVEDLLQLLHTLHLGHSHVRCLTLLSDLRFEGLLQLLFLVFLREATKILFLATSFFTSLILSSDMMSFRSASLLAS